MINAKEASQVADEVVKGCLSSTFRNIQRTSKEGRYTFTEYNLNDIQVDYLERLGYEVQKVEYTDSFTISWLPK